MLWHLVLHYDGVFDLIRAYFTHTRFVNIYSLQSPVLGMLCVMNSGVTSQTTPNVVDHV